MYEFKYNLQPQYDREQWREEYLQTLQLKRVRYTKMWQDIQNKCEIGEMSGVMCRTADSVLDKMENWLNYLADDGIRVCEALLSKEAPGLLARIKDEYTGRADKYVMKGAAPTCGLVHDYLFSFYDLGATGTIYAIYERLPAELKQLYTLEQLNGLNSAFQTYDD